MLWSMSMRRWWPGTAQLLPRYYGCGLVIPECLLSCRILDLGCGSGRDCYLLSQLVGEQGHVTGIDMTEGQVEVAKKHIAYHMNKFGYRKPNVEFLHGYMEKLGDAGLADESYDIVISNCVINLTPDKKAVLQEAFRVLKPGGEMYFSDVYASQRLSETIRKHRVLWGECLAGALYWRDLYSITEEVGFSPPCLVTASPITIGDKELEGIIGDCRFVSATFRLFKVPGGSRAGPGQVIYNGGIMGHERELVFDANFTFKVQGVLQAVLVCRDGLTLMKQCHSGVSSVIWGTSFGQRGDDWEQRGCVNPGECKWAGKGYRSMHCIAVKIEAGHPWWLPKRV
ncbi:arsenite methyltransferase isoform X2 [Pipra filicauda]|uniref:Arsenite methyltransferase n=1 Tax=Pipra filicauda TaxID=649802 RepID=A0A7R5L6Y4_9PASS|nr:arsenite methyltransferase isoform X2 [Pipra filicauda]